MNKQYKYKGQEKKQKNKIFQDSCFFFFGGGGGAIFCPPPPPPPKYVPLQYVRLKLVNHILFQAFTLNIFPTKPTQ